MEKGTHCLLVAKGGLLEQLYETKFGGEPEAAAALTEGPCSAPGASYRLHQCAHFIVRPSPWRWSGTGRSGVTQ